MSPNSPKKHLLLVGAGHAHLQMLAEWKSKNLERFKITLVSNEDRTIYSGMVPGFLMGFYSPENIRIDVSRFARQLGIDFVSGSVKKIDAKSKSVILLDGQKIDFDLLSLNIGGRGSDEVARPNFLQVRPLTKLVKQWFDLLGDLRNWNFPRRPQVAIIGGGAAGFELAMALARISSRYKSQPQLTLFEQDQLLKQTGSRAKKIAAHELKAVGVNVQLGASGADAQRGSDFYLVATSVGPNPIFRESGLPTDQAGFLCVTDSLQVAGYESIFGAGDSVVMPTPVPHSGVYAVRQGQHLAKNIWAALNGEAIGPYRPMKNTLALITLGEKRVLACYGNWAVSGKWLWSLKDSIDRKFMSQF